ncbi:hypothetical protein [Paenibacillus tarimensis]|uniref:hypothetical protein n=1 Tax=Paenibacillus tarimensis TaxID=416012 RepID=UPI001F435375|nr:hypothetical protein [Paenibacillus tarimensis]MCF2946429.1 hypothetical protein [Paenibacillus tarimensis]
MPERYTQLLQKGKNMDELIEDITEIIIQICLDLRPCSIIDKHKFNELYTKFNELKHVINKKNAQVISKELVRALLYVSDGIIVQCNFSRKKDHLINEWIILNKEIISLLRSNDLQINIVGNEHQLMSTSNEIEIQTACLIFDQLHKLIMQSALISNPQKYEVVDSLYKTDNKFLNEYWDHLKRIEN